MSKIRKKKVIPFNKTVDISVMTSPEMVKFLNLKPDKKHGELSSTVSVVFATARELIGLGIGYTKDVFEPFGVDLDEYQPWSVDSLLYSVEAATIGVKPAGEVAYPVEKSDCKVNVVININGKYCKLNQDEWQGSPTLLGELRLIDQMSIYRRLLMQGQITFEDLAAADIDNNMYHQLCEIEEMPNEMFTIRMNILDKWIKRQMNDPQLYKMYRSFIKSIGSDY